MIKTPSCFLEEQILIVVSSIVAEASFMKLVRSEIENNLKMSLP